jgi:hypothetical protein
MMEQGFSVFYRLFPPSTAQSLHNGTIGLGRTTPYQFMKNEIRDASPEGEIENN